MIRVPQAGRATTTETNDTDTREATTTTAKTGPQEMVVHGAVRGIMDTPLVREIMDTLLVRATAATILASRTMRGGEEIQARPPTLKVVVQGINP